MSASFLRRLLCTAALAGGLLVLGGGAANASDIVPDGDAILTQTQDATNTNTTDQDATPNAEPTQFNVNTPIAILSPGANSGDVNQSNTADTSATAVNGNTTDQSVTQDQDGATSGGCGSCGDGSVSQDQSGENSNHTDQDAEANAETNQYNVNAPISILSPGANGSSCDPCGGSGGDVNQSNDADTSAWAGNSNETTQTVDQSQDGTVAGSGFCGCEAPSIEQSQTGTNDNSTDQDATANAETTQVNVNAPVAILSPGANSGDVTQSNQADTNATAYNGNTTDQSVGQVQHAAVRGDGCGTCNAGGGSISQDQSGENTNDTDQDATANASTEQKNWNTPIAILSPGANSGDVNQSNDATTTAWAGNSNETDQSIDQAQDAVLVGCGCFGGGSISQAQDATNDNRTDQDAAANATTEQKNVNAPIAILSPSCGCGGGGGDVNQSNTATTNAWAGNWNSTSQSVNQEQAGRVSGHDGCGGCQPNPCDCDPHPCDCEPSPCLDRCEPSPCEDTCEPDPCHDTCVPSRCQDTCDPRPCGCLHDGSIDQSQAGSNTNDTRQNAEANAHASQKNENEPFSFLIPGASGGGVTQSNDATTNAWAGNWNATDQAVDQRQFAALR